MKGLSFTVVRVSRLGSGVAGFRAFGVQGLGGFISIVAPRLDRPSPVTNPR